MNNMRITKRLLKDGVITSEEWTIIEYGIQNLRDNLIGFFLIVMIGAWLSEGVDGLLLYLLVLPLRKNAGGFHAKTKMRCMLISVAVTVIAFWGVHQIVWTKLQCLILCITSASIIVLLAPVENENKKLDITEVSVYQARTRLVLGMEGLVLSGAMLFDVRRIYLLIGMCFAIVGTALMIGKGKMIYGRSK